MNEAQIKRLIASHTKILNILISYYKPALIDLESMPAVQLLFEKAIREGVKVETLIKGYGTSKE